MNKFMYNEMFVKNHVLNLDSVLVTLGGAFPFHNMPTLSLRNVSTEVLLLRHHGWQLF